MSNKNFTYDYEGNLLAIKSVSIDKLPPPNYIVKYFTLIFYFKK